MHRILALFLASLLVLSAACSRQEKPPVGRWVGVYDSPMVIVNARLEILPDGTVRVSAPDIMGVGALPPAERKRLHNHLAIQLVHRWEEARPRQMDFDGRIFRKPGGVAPQIEWDPGKRQMKLVFYFGLQKSIRITMRQVETFPNNPW